MQLEKIVNYHKALSDPTRLRMLLLLSKGRCTDRRWRRNLIYHSLP